MCCCSGDCCIVEETRSSLWRLPLRVGASATRLAQDVKLVRGLAVDVAAGHLYYFSFPDAPFASGATPTLVLSRVPIGGGPATVVWRGAGFQSPDVATVDATHVYWQTPSEVVRVAKSGGREQVLVRAGWVLAMNADTSSVYVLVREGRPTRLLAIDKAAPTRSRRVARIPAAVPISAGRIVVGASGTEVLLEGSVYHVDSRGSVSLRATEVIDLLGSAASDLTAVGLTHSAPAQSTVASLPWSGAMSAVAPAVADCRDISATTGQATFIVSDRRLVCIGEAAIHVAPQ